MTGAHLDLDAVEHKGILDEWSCRTAAAGEIECIITAQVAAGVTARGRAACVRGRRVSRVEDDLHLRCPTAARAQALRIQAARGVVLDTLQLHVARIAIGRPGRGIFPTGYVALVDQVNLVALWVGNQIQDPAVDLGMPTGHVEVLQRISGAAKLFRDAVGQPHPPAGRMDRLAGNGERANRRIDPGV